MVAVDHSAQDKMKYVHESGEPNSPCRKMLRVKEYNLKMATKSEKFFF